MKNPIGVNTWVWAAPFTDGSVELVATIAKMGFDVLEIAVEDPAHFRGKTLANALRDSGLRPTICGAFGRARDLTHEDSQYRRQSLQYIADVLALCERWGVKIFCGPMYSAAGKSRHISSDQRRREWDLAVVGLREAASMAADYGVILAIEPLNRFETDLVNTSAQAVRLVDEIDSPQVKVHLDTFHMAIEENSIYEAIQVAGSRLAHIHACENNRGTPGTGMVDWPQLVLGLEAVGYKGALVIESFTMDCDSIAAAVWRPLAPSQDALAREGLAFMHRLFPAGKSAWSRRVRPH